MVWMMPFSMGQKKPAVIRLKVFHDGQERPAPNRIPLSFDKQTLHIPIKNGAFEIPLQALPASDVNFSADIDRIHITMVITPESFADIFSWEISIADKQYGKDFDCAVPAEADIRKSCIVVFLPINRDGWWILCKLWWTQKKVVFG